MLDDDSKELVSVAAKGAVEGILKPVHDLILDLAGPAAREFGEAWRTEVRVWRLGRAARHAQRVREFLEPLGLNRRDVPVRFLLRSIEEASLEEDDDLQDRWAMLLANAAAGNERITILPGYIDILRQLTPTHAAVLDMLYAAHGDSISLQPEPVADEYEWRGYQPTPAETIIDRFSLPKRQYNVLASDLHRLQVIDGDRWGGGSVDAGPSGPTSYESIHITPLGRAFVRACTPPKP
ncbi:MAG: DUF4393 domain-containing protein [Acidobacteria bacterium]|nr:DUF4393 domain-containing protein [Acidobacteriota bacterium]